MRTPLLLLLLTTATLAGCLTGGETDTEDLAPARQPVDTPFVEFLHSLSEPIPGVSVGNSIVEQYRIVGHGGFELDTWIVRPNIDEPVPIVLEVTPYYGGGDPTLSPLNPLGRLANEIIPRGYAFGISSVRGTGNSEGCFTQGGTSEAKDTAAVVEYLAAQPWANGNVGLIGVSYPGTTPQDVWVEAPPSLKTVVPISGISDLYKYNFVNGVPIDIQGLGFNTYYWAIVGLGPAGLTGGVQLLDPLHVPGAVIGEACTDQIHVQWGGVSSTLTGDKHGYWQERDFLAELHADWDRERASVFFIHGLQDWNVKPHNMEDWVEAIQETGVPFKAWLGQWGHAWPSGAQCPEEARCRNDWWEHALIAWFDQFLKGIDTGILDAPPVQIQDDTMRWRHEASWPPQGLEWQSWYLDGDALSEAGAGSGSVSYHDYNGRLADRYGAPLADTGALGDDRVVWRSAPLAADLHLSGLPVFTGNVTASGDRASLILTLGEEDANGTYRAINFAAQSLNHVASLETGRASVAGLEQTVTVRFFPQDDVVQQGSRLVLIAAGNTVGGPGPALIPLSDGSTISLDMASARLDLPVLPDVVLEAVQPFDIEEGLGDTNHCGPPRHSFNYSCAQTV